MPYRLQTADPALESALRRIAGEQLRRALRSLEATGEVRPAAIHDVRKRCKKLRALLRLVRSAFPGRAQENAALREVGRLLGAARDAGVLHHTLDAVLAEEHDLPDPEALAPLRAELAGEDGDHALAPAELDAAFAQARTLLEQVAARAPHWTLEADGSNVLAPGIAAPYRAARKARKRAARKPSARNHHEWRKRVKDHWYHTRLLRDLQPGELAPRALLARDLAEALGAHHDCHVLEQALAPGTRAGALPAAAQIASLARTGRAALEHRAHALGRELLADKPGRLARRWGDWWDARQGAGEHRPSGAWSTDPVAPPVGGGFSRRDARS